MTADLIKKLEALTGTVDAVTAAGISNSLSPWATESPEWLLFCKALNGSVDAAMKLGLHVLGKEIIYRHTWSNNENQTQVTHLFRPRQTSEDETYGFKGVGATQPITLCIAILKAKEASHAA